MPAAKIIVATDLPGWKGIELNALQLCWTHTLNCSFSAPAACYCEFIFRSGLMALETTLPWKGFFFFNWYAVCSELVRSRGKSPFRQQMYICRIQVTCEIKYDVMRACFSFCFLLVWLRKLSGFVLKWFRPPYSKRKLLPARVKWFY